MKKIAFVLGLLFTATLAFSADPLTPLIYQYPVVGTPVDNTFKATLGDTATSLQTLVEAAGITWLRNGQPPQGVLLSIETNDARVGVTGIGAAGTVGHVFAVGSSWHLAGAGFLDALKLCNSAAGSNAVVQITLER